MFSNFTDMQIVGLVTCTTIIFLLIRYVVKKLKMYPFMQFQKIAKDVNVGTVNGKTNPDVARKAITLTIMTTRLIAPAVKKRDTKQYKELLICTNNLVGSWLKSYPEWDAEDPERIVIRLKEWNFKMDMFSDSLLHGNIDEAEDLIAVLPTTRLQDNMYDLIDSFKN